MRGHHDIIGSNNNAWRPLHCPACLALTNLLLLLFPSTTRHRTSQSQCSLCIFTSLWIRKNCYVVSDYIIIIINSVIIITYNIIIIILTASLWSLLMYWFCPANWWLMIQCSEATVQQQLINKREHRYHHELALWPTLGEQQPTRWPPVNMKLFLVTPHYIISLIKCFFLSDADKLQTHNNQIHDFLRSSILHYACTRIRTECSVVLSLLQYQTTELYSSKYIVNIATNYFYKSLCVK